MVPVVILSSAAAAAPTSKLRAGLGYPGPLWIELGANSSAHFCVDCENHSW